MSQLQMPEGEAIVYCEGAFDKTDGKTAHGLVRFTRRYRVVAVVDSQFAGQDAGVVLEGRKRDIPIVRNLEEGTRRLSPGAKRFFVFGLAVVGGRFSVVHKQAIAEAIRAGFNVDAGLHDFLTEDVELFALAQKHGVALRDVRKPPARGALHAFTGKIEEVTSFKVAVLGTDSAVGKRTTAWKIVEGYEAAGRTAELIGTGQTAWLQGARYSVCMDALINDFVAGELEHATWSAWNEKHPDVIVLEGQGSLLNPGFPGGFEILAACRPDVVVLQHPPARKTYDDFPQYRIHPLTKQIEAIQVISDRPVVMITVSREKLDPAEYSQVVESIAAETGLPVIDPLSERGPHELFSGLSEYQTQLLKKTA